MSKSFQDKELEILRNAVDKNQKKIRKKIVSNPDIKKIINIVENFLIKNKRICYGGTAINNILPIEDQFYDREVDIPDYDFFSDQALKDAKKLANKVSKNKTNFGILVCGSGTGMAMAANKVKNIRAAVCYNVKNTKLSRLHNNANVITVGSRLTSKNLAFKLVNIFLKTKFEGGRHLRRIKKI